MFPTAAKKDGDGFSSSSSVESTAAAKPPRRKSSRSKKKTKNSAAKSSEKDKKEPTKYGSGIDRESRLNIGAMILIGLSNGQFDLF